MDFIARFSALFKHVDLPLLQKGLVVAAGIFLLWLVLLTVVHSLGRRSAFYRSNATVVKCLRQFVTFFCIYIIFSYLTDVYSLDNLSAYGRSVLVLVMAWPARSIAGGVLTALRHRATAQQQSPVRGVVLDLAFKLNDVVVLSIFFIFALHVLGINIMPFLASAGIAGIAIGFAAKDTLSNMIAGILLIIDRPFEIGDRLELWQAPPNHSTWGDVIQIGLQMTKIRTTDNIVVVIPNSQIMNRDIINYTVGDTSMRVRITVGVAYGTDLEKAAAVMVEIAKSSPWAQTTIAPKVVTRSFADSCIELQLRVWIKDARKRTDAISEICNHIKQRFQAEGIQIPFPQREVRLLSPRQSADNG